MEIWCPSSSDVGYLPLDKLAHENRLPLVWGPRPPRHRVFSALTFYRNSVAQLKALDDHAKLCAKEIGKKGFDVLLSHPCTYLRVPHIGRYSTIPAVLYLQEPSRWLYEAMPKPPCVAPRRVSHIWRRPREWKRAADDYARIQSLRVMIRDELENIHAFHTVLVNSLYSRESVLRTLGIGAHVCYLGIDSERFRNLGLKREMLVLGVGAFVPEKRVEFVIRAVGEITTPRPKLVWIGNAGIPRYISRLRALAESLDVDFEPILQVTEEELVLYLNRASVFAYAPRLEPFGYAPLEANACGTPVVAVAEGGVRETVADGRNGTVVEDEPKAMAEALAELLSDHRKRSRLARTGRVFVEENWSLNAAADRLDNWLTKAVKCETEAPIAT